jgi:DNA modification methylase
VAESFMDGLSKLIAEHNIEVPTGKENALETALSEVDKLNESLKSRDVEIASIQETIKKLQAASILESFKEKMTSTEFDRFTQLTESVAYTTEDQYKKQLDIVLENFGSKQKTAPVAKKAELIAEDVIGATKVETVVHSNVEKYAAFLSKK